MIFDNSNNVKRAYLYLFLFLLPTLIFLNNELIWDDQLIVKAHAVWSFKALLGPYGMNSGSYWRPVTVLFIAIPYLAGLPVWFCKLISVGLFFIQGCLAIAIVNLQFQKKSAANKSIPIIALAILVALHPVFVETILWMSARADLLIGTWVLLGVYWIIKLQDQENNARTPESKWIGSLRGFFLVWMICGSKDSGIVWAGLGLLTILFFCAKSTAFWKTYWRYFALGILSGTISYLAIRMILLGAVTELNNITVRNAASAISQIRFFCEFISRAILNIFIPVFDAAPFKSAGWFDSVPPGLAIMLLIVIAAVCAMSIRWLYSKNKTSAWLAFCALIAIVFHALVETFIEPTYGSILADRYLAPSTILIYIALVRLLVNQVADEVSPHKAKPFKLTNTLVAVIWVIVIIQALFLWTETRDSWSTNLGLWKNSWAHGSRSKIVATNYSLALMNAKDFSGSIKVAQSWIEGHKEYASPLQQCSFYDVLLKNYINLNDEIHANSLAQQALKVGWCYPDLAQNIGFILMRKHCKQVLPMLIKTLEEGKKPEGIGLWKYENVDSKVKTLSLTAYAEARCGQDDNARNLLKKLAKMNREWEVDGELAQSLIKAAHTTP